MKRYISESGKEHWKDVRPESKFDENLFHDVDMGINVDDVQCAFHTNIGSLTVLDRLTGFGWRDTETGFCDPDGNFWLASGGYDVRSSDCDTVGDAIQWVKDRANNCKGNDND